MKGSVTWTCDRKKKGGEEEEEENVFRLLCRYCDLV